MTSCAGVAATAPSGTRASSNSSTKIRTYGRRRTLCWQTAAKPSECLGITLYFDRYRMAVQARCVVPAELTNHVRRQIADLFVDRLLGVRPGGVAMRIIGFQHDVVHAYSVTLHERRLVLHCAEPEVPGENLRRSQTFTERLPGAVHRVIAEHVVEAIQQPRDPA